MAKLTKVPTVPKNSPAAELSEFLAALMIILGVLGMAASSPPLVGPDEAAHQATANYTTVHILPPRSESMEYTPGFVKHGACTSQSPQTDAGCMPSREDISPGKVRVLNYPPPYYWVVGLGQKFAPTADTWMDVGGRVASMTLNLGGLLLLALLLRRRVRSWGTYLLAVATPMAAFLWAVVNPNGWEITAGMIFVYFLARAWWDSDEILGRIPRPWIAFGSVGLASIAFALSRHDAIVWLTLLVIAVTLTGTTLSRSRQLLTLVASTLGVFAGLFWQMFYPAQHVLNNPDRIEEPVPLDYLHWFNEIDAVLPDRMRQMVGVLGWLDTPVPQSIVLSLLLGWGALVGFLIARTRVSPLFLVAGFAGTVIVPGLLETLRWNDWPYWWQGRITLSFTIPFLFLLLLRYGAHGRRAIVLLSIVNGLVLTYMVWQNLSRYSFGIRNYIPLRGNDPAIGDFWFTIVIVILTLMLLASVARISIFLRERKSAASEVAS